MFISPLFEINDKYLFQRLTPPVDMSHPGIVPIIALKFPTHAYMALALLLA
jgi:hypothetical protein